MLILLDNNNFFLNQPLEQFETICIGSIYIFSTNNGLNKLVFCFTIFTYEHFLIFVPLFLYMIFYIFFFEKNISFFWYYLNFFNNIFLSCFQFIFSFFFSQCRHKILYCWFVFVVSLFIYIVCLNIAGLIPYNFCISSQLVMPFIFSFMVFIGLFIISLYFQGLNFIFFFIPSGVPKIILPILILIEIVSYLSRIFSLAIRLFANMVAGHSLIFILSSAVLNIIKYITSIYIYLFIICIPLILLVMCIIILEVGIAFLQAYVFAVLVSIYFSDCYFKNH